MFARLMLFLCVILHTMWSSKSLQFPCILSFGMLCLFSISMIFVQIMLAVCMLVGTVVLAEAYVNCVQSAFSYFLKVSRFWCSL